MVLRFKTGPVLSELSLGLEHVGDILQAEVFQGFALGRTGIGVPSLDIVEMSLPLLDALFGEVELFAVFPVPFRAVVDGQFRRESAVGSSGLVIVAGEVFHLSVSALENEDRALHIPGSPADFQAIFESVISSGDGFEEFGLSLRRVPFAFLVGLVEQL